MSSYYKTNEERDKAISQGKYRDKVRGQKSYSPSNMTQADLDEMCSQCELATYEAYDAFPKPNWIRS